MWYQLHFCLFSINSCIYSYLLTFFFFLSPDLITNLSIARQGFPKMGLSACFGGPLLSILFSQTSSKTIKNENWLKQSINHDCEVKKMKQAIITVIHYYSNYWWLNIIKIRKISLLSLKRITFDYYLINLWSFCFP